MPQCPSKATIPPDVYTRQVGGYSPLARGIFVPQTALSSVCLDCEACVDSDRDPFSQGFHEVRGQL